MMQAKAPTRRRNALLDRLTARDFALLEARLRPATFEFRKSLQQSNRRISAAYFLDSGVASVTTSKHHQTEVALIGREGMTGISVLYGVERSPWDVFIQVEGEGQCIDAADLRDALDKSVSLHRALLRFAFIFTAQTAHTAVANAHAKLEERLARWLLMTQDRIVGPEMTVTHEFLALMLGVRRAGVSVALRDLEAKGLIQHRRRRVGILDRDGLIAAANGFYGGPEAEAERLFPGWRSAS